MASPEKVVMLEAVDTPTVHWVTGTVRVQRSQRPFYHSQSFIAVIIVLGRRALSLLCVPSQGVYPLGRGFYCVLLALYRLRLVFY